MKTDIKSKEDISLIVHTFYNKLLSNPVLKDIFLNTIAEELEHHLPRICSFWTTILLSPDDYRGNVINKHVILNKRYKLLDSHFDIWLTLWKETIHKSFQGEVTDEAIKKAELMKDIMLLKIRASEKPGFIQ